MRYVDKIPRYKYQIPNKYQVPKKSKNSINIADLFDEKPRGLALGADYHKNVQSKLPKIISWQSPHLSGWG